MSTSELIIVEAVRLAQELHRNQQRKSGIVPGIPYLSHLLEVGGMVMANGGNDIVVAAAILHDAIEDQGTYTHTLIEQRLGKQVLELVEICTEEGTEEELKAPWRVRKEAYLKHLKCVPLPALLIIVADKLQSARELVRQLHWTAKNQGEEALSFIWNRFNGGREGTLWFQESLVWSMRDRLLQLRQVQLDDPLLAGTEALIDDFATTVNVLKKL